MNIGNKLRILMEDRDITQKQLATDLNIAPTTLSGYVLNTSEPDFITLRALAKYFDVSSDYLLDIQVGKTATHAEDELLRVFRSMTTEQQGMYIEQGRVFVRANQKGNA